MLSYEGVFEDNAVVFSNESAEYLTHCTKPNIFISVISLLALIFMIIKYYMTPKKIIFYNALFILIWLLSGRTLGIKTALGGKVSAGWYCYRTTTFILCSEKIDCEGINAYETQVIPLSFWRVQIKNSKAQCNIFIGPIMWKKSLALLNSEFGNGKYYK
jgi:hypothetical protein